MEKIMRMTNREKFILTNRATEYSGQQHQLMGLSILVTRKA